MKLFTTYGVFRFPLPDYIKIATIKTHIPNGGWGVNRKCFQKPAPFLSNLGIGHPYNRDEFFLKVGFSRIIRVCQGFIGTGRWRLVM